MPAIDPDNIDCFEQAAAALLTRLFEAFPRPLMIVSRELEIELVSRNLITPACVWPESMARPSECLTGATLTWLCEEGFARFKSENAGRFSGVVLTAKGFRALNSPVVESPALETNGQRLRKASKGAGEFLLSTVINGIITAGTGAAVNSQFSS